MATTDKKTDVATKKEAGLPAGLDLDQMKADAGHNPDLDTGDIALPFIGLLQSNSPQLVEGTAEYIDGARAGMFMNTVTGEVFNGRDTGLLIIPCHYERKYVEWIDRDKGGGWVAEYPITSDILSYCRQDDRKKWRLPNTNLVVETAYHYVLAHHPETEKWFQAVVGMKSSALKQSRALNNSIVSTTIPGTDIQAPWWLYGYNMTSKLEQKNDDKYYNWRFAKMDEPVSSEQYAKAKEFAELVKAGVLNRTAETEQGTKHDPETGEVVEGQAEKPAEDNVPYN